MFVSLDLNLNITMNMTFLRQLQNCSYGLDMIQAYYYYVGEIISVILCKQCVFRNGY